MPSHKDKDSRTWTQSQWTTRTPSHSLRHLQLNENRIKQGVFNRSIPSAAWDTARNSNAGKVGGPFIPTAIQSNKVFALADGHPTPATIVSLLKNNLREAARTVHIVPALAHQSLLSGGQFADAGYISICDGNEVNIYDEKTANINVSEKSVLKGWRCPTTKLWRIPLQDSISNANTDNLLLDGPTVNESLNALYSVPSTTATTHHIASSTAADRPSSLDTINNVYELPSIEKIRTIPPWGGRFPP